MKWIPHRQDGDQTPIEARKFKHWIGTQEHWFCWHESLNHVNGWTVSDWASGYRVADFSAFQVLACRGDKKAAARLALNRLVERVGEGRVLEVLRNAPARKKVFPKAVADATI